MDEAGIMSVQHIVGGILSGFICYGFQKGMFGLANEFIGVIISLIIVYLLGKHAENKYGRETIGLSSWIMNGIVPFYFICMVIWIVLLNYVGI